MKEPVEEWRAIAEFPDYAVSNLGRVKRATPGRNTHPGRILSIQLNTWGYSSVGLCRDGRGHSQTVHRLVALAFLGGRSQIRNTINHKNAIKTDNRASNLEWCSQQENIDHAGRMGHRAFGEKNGTHTNPDRVCRGIQHGLAKLSESGVAQLFILVRAGWSTPEICRYLGVGRTTVFDTKAGRRWNEPNG